MSVGVVGAFACPGAITAQAVSTILSVASGRYPYWRQSFPIKGNCTVPPPFSLRVTPPSSTADGWPSCTKEGSETRLWLNSGACATVKKGKRGACKQKAATVLPDRTAAT